MADAALKFRIVRNDIRRTTTGYNVITDTHFRAHLLAEHVDSI